MRKSKSIESRLNVLITGCNGYIGTVLTPMIQELGHQTVGIDTYFFRDCTFFPNTQLPQFLPRDIRDLTVEDLRGVDAIIHLAALSNDPMGALNSDWTNDINYAGSVSLAQTAKKAGVKRFLFSSSCSVYGTNESADLLAEGVPTRPFSRYAISKLRAEKAISNLASLTFSPVFMRNGTAYGISPQLRTDLVLNNLVGWAFTTGKVRVLRNANPWRPLVHVEDIAGAFLTVLTAPRSLIHNQIFNISSSEENYQICHLIDIVNEITGCEIIYAAEGEPDQRSYKVSSRKFTQTFPNFCYKWNVKLGVQELYQSFQKYTLKFKDFKSNKYNRLNYLKYLINTKLLDKTLRWQIFR